MPDVTQLLHAIEAGEPTAAEQLLPLVYDELRRLAALNMAREKPGQTNQAMVSLEKSLQLDPTHREAWELKGRLLPRGGFRG